MANFEWFCRVISSSINLLFLKSVTQYVFWSFWPYHCFDFCLLSNNQLYLFIFIFIFSRRYSIHQQFLPHPSINYLWPFPTLDSIKSKIYFPALALWLFFQPNIIGQLQGQQDWKNVIAKVTVSVSEEMLRSLLLVSMLEVLLR